MMTHLHLFSRASRHLHVTGQFQVTLHLCFKTSPHSKPFICKWLSFAWQLTWRRNRFSFLWFLHEDLFWHRSESELGNTGLLLGVLTGSLYGLQCSLWLTKEITLDLGFETLNWNPLLSPGQKDRQVVGSGRELNLRRDWQASSQVHASREKKNILRQTILSFID